MDKLPTSYFNNNCSKKILLLVIKHTSIQHLNNLNKKSEEIKKRKKVKICFKYYWKAPCSVLSNFQQYLKKNSEAKIKQYIAARSTK